jgi:hypothetical protein
MLESGDWLVPRLGETVRLQKPPLYYWLATAVERVAGEAANAWLRAPRRCARSYSWWRGAGALGGGAQHGLLAAALLVGLVGVAEFGRMGVAETLLGGQLERRAAGVRARARHGLAPRACGPACWRLAVAAVLAKATPVPTSRCPSG